MQKSQYIRDLQCDKVYWFLYCKKNLQLNLFPTKNISVDIVKFKLAVLKQNHLIENYRGKEE
jgi:hypothetical protein